MRKSPHNVDLTLNLPKNSKRKKLVNKETQSSFVTKQKKIMKIRMNSPMEEELAGQTTFRKSQLSSIYKDS